MYPVVVIAAAAALLSANTETSTGGGAASAIQATTATTSATTDPRMMAAEGKPARRYCVVQKITTGTILARKTCLTRDEWIARGGIDPAVTGK